MININEEVAIALNMRANKIETGDTNLSILDLINLKAYHKIRVLSQDQEDLVKELRSTADELQFGEMVLYIP